MSTTLEAPGLPVGVVVQRTSSPATNRAEAAQSLVRHYATALDLLQGLQPLGVAECARSLEAPPSPDTVACQRLARVDATHLTSMRCTRNP